MLPSGRYQFGEFLLDLSERALFRQGELVPLTPKSLETLLFLVERRGHIVEKDELMKAVWPDTFVEEVSLARNVSVLRKVLSDGLDGRAYIETIPKRGYRFVAPVSEVPREVPASSVETKRKLAASVIAGGLVLAAAVAALMGYFLLHRAATLTEKDSIILADFTNATGDPVFDGTLRQGLAVQLAQSPFLMIASKSRVRRALDAMGESSDAPLTPKIARELCERTGSTVVLDGSIARVGMHYAVILNADRCVSGKTIASAEAQASDREHVLDALGKAASEMRARLGESAVTVQKYDTPIEQATTASLEALQAYSLARRIIDLKGDYAAAVPVLQGAIRLDPQFAVAYAGLGTSYFALDESDLSAETLQKAYDLRERLSQREKLEIESLFYWFTAGDLEKARNTYERWQQVYPRDDVPHNNLSVIYQQLGENEKSLEEARECFQLDPDSGLSYANLADSYLFLGRLKEARAAAEEAQAKHFDSPHLRFYLHRIAFLRDDPEGMKQQVNWAAGKPGADELITQSQANVEAYFGHFQKARELFQKAVDLSLKSGDKDAAATYEVNWAGAESDFGNSRQARRRIADALRLSPSPDVRVTSAMVLAAAGDSAFAQKTADEAVRSHPQDTVLLQIDVPSIRAELEMLRNNPSDSIRLLQPVARYELGSEDRLNSPYLRGLAYLRLHKGAEAAAEFQKVLDHRAIYQNNARGALAQLGLARAYAMQDDLARARSAYQTLLAIWKDADPDLALRRQARQESARLN